MNRTLAIVAAALTFAACNNTVQPATIQVIPQPQQVQVSGRVIPQSRCRIAEPRIDSSLKPEEYILKVGCLGRARITAGSEQGVLYAKATVGQQFEKEGGLHPGTIRDWPRYQWRGVMLDEARHFFGTETVKLLLDEMYRLKLNKFHWHLSDQQGWRVQIDAYPLLATVGGTGTHSDIHAPAQYYTKDQIRDIVAYAADRGIEVIPEIDMPGHVSALCKAYPEYGGGGNNAGFPNYTLNIGLEDTYLMLETVLAEIADLFPSEYLMIGGDEVGYGSYAWATNPDIQALMKREGCADAHEAEGWFIRRVQGIVAKLGKRMMGWDDTVTFVDKGTDATMFWWRHDRPERLHQVLEGGFPTILCPRQPMYFDYLQADSLKVGHKWMHKGFCPIEDVYAFPDSLYSAWQVDDAQMAPVIGIQCNVWTEIIHNRNRLDFTLFPRLYAVSEAAWTLPENKNFAGFAARLQPEYDHMDSRGIYYFDASATRNHPEPEGPVIGERFVK